MRCLNHQTTREVPRRTFKIYSFSNFQIGSTTLLILVTMLYIRSPWLIYYWKFVPFDLLYPFCLFPTPPQQPPICSFIDEFFFLMPHISEIIQCFSLIYFTQHNTVNVIHVVAHGRIFLFYGWINFQCIYIHHSFFICLPLDGRLGGFHILAIANEYCSGHGGSYTFLNYCFHFLWINIQKWNYWVIW